jgi:hypothetical protein
VRVPKSTVDGVAHVVNRHPRLEVDPLGYAFRRILSSEPERAVYDHLRVAGGFRAVFHFLFW